MKKIFILISLMVCISQGSYSQITWCPSGAIWHYNISWNVDHGYAEIKYISDTILSGFPCKKLIEHQRYRSITGGPEINNYKNLYTYDSGNVVFMYNLLQGSNNWDTLINFNINPGGSWYYNNIDTLKVEVLDTGTQIINGNSLKWIYIDYHPNLGIGFYDTIYNRIGCVGTFYPFNVLGSLSSDPLIYGFCNYSDSSFALYGNSDSACTQIPSGINELNNIENSILVFPNPSTGEITINEKGIFELYDLTGRKLFYKNCTASNTKIKLPETLCNGVYLYHLTQAETGLIKWG